MQCVIPPAAANPCRVQSFYHPAIHTGALIRRTWIASLILFPLLFFLFSTRIAMSKEKTTPHPRKTYTIQPASSPIHVDGRLNEPAWKTATRIELTYEWFPGNNTTPPVKTLCLVTYDASHFYVAFIAEDPDPSAIRAHLMDRDQIEELALDDYVGFMIDTFNDERRAFQFRVNPLGVQAEAMNSDIEQDEDWNWDIIWESAGRITKTGYTVEIAIPLKQLRFPRTDRAMTWGFLAMRSWPRDVRHRIRSSYTDLNRNCLICQFDKMTGIQNVKSGLNLELDPTLTTLRADQRPDFPNGPLVNGSVNPDVGISLRWNPLSNVTLNATVNPDFSQVEADSPQLEVNRRFALFFPEKRPFFLEGADFFQVPSPLVFTRTISDPNFGLKLTAREGRHSVGLLVADDTLNNLILPSNQRSALASLDQHVTTAIGRYRLDVGSASSIGFLLTNRQSSNYFNRIASFDSLFRITRKDFILSLVSVSWTDYPEAISSTYQQPEGTFSGTFYGLAYEHSTRNWNWNGSFAVLTPGYRADTGFMPQVDLRDYEASLQRTWWSNNRSWWTNVSTFIRFSHIDNTDGRLTSENLNVGMNVRGPLQSVFRIQYTNGREWFNNTIFSRDFILLSFWMQPSGSINFGFFTQVGEAIDFTGSRPARELRFRPTLQWKPGRHINLQLSWLFQRLTINEGHLFTEQVTELRTFYHFNARTFIRAILQYRDIRRSPERFAFPVKSRTQNLFLQLLGSYRLNSRTVLLVGFSNNHRGETGFPLTQTDRTFFIKLGYAFLL